MTKPLLVVPLGDVVELVMGQAPSSKDCNFDGRGTPFVKVGEFGEVRPVLREWTTNPLRMAHKSDVLLCVVGATCGKINLGEHCAIGRSVAALRPHPERLNQFYLYYFMMTLVERLRAGSLGAAQTVISKGMIKAVSMPLVPLDEQQRIVVILDKAFEGIATAKANVAKNLQNVRDLFDSHLRFTFETIGRDWPRRPIRDVAEHSLGKMLDKAKNRGVQQPYLRNLNVRWFTCDVSDLKEMPFEPEEKAKYTAVRGDVLVCEGGYPGRAAIWTEDHPIHFQKALHRVRFHEPSHNKWFVYYLYSQDRSGALRQHFSGTGIQHFTGETLDRLEVPLPPPAELRRLLRRFEELDADTQQLASLYEQKVVAIDGLKKSLLHQAFSGNL